MMLQRFLYLCGEGLALLVLRLQRLFELFQTLALAGIQ